MPIYYTKELRLTGNDDLALVSTWCMAADKDSDPGLPISTTHTFYSLKSTYFLSLYLNLTHRGGKVQRLSPAASKGD